jgi:hypothetical protein
VSALYATPPETVARVRDIFLSQRK